MTWTSTAASTAYEMKSLYGVCCYSREESKGNVYVRTYVKTLLMMIQHEERCLERVLQQLIGLIKPVIPLQEEFEKTQKNIKAIEKYRRRWPSSLKRNEGIRATLESGKCLKV